MNRRRMLILMGLLPAAAAAVPVAQHLLERGRAGRVRPGGGFHREHFPNVVLRTQDGRWVRLYDDLLRGRTVLVHFFHTGCQEGVCIAASENLAKLQRLLGNRCGRDVHLYSITLAPSQDTPARLKHHQQTVKAGPGWTFLTGSPGDLETCRSRFGLVDSEPERGDARTSHTGVVLLGHEPNERWMVWPVLTDPECLLDQLDRVAGVKN